MSIRTYCAECDQQTIDGVLRHTADCTANKLLANRGVEYLRQPATRIEFDTPKEQETFMRNLTKSSGTADYGSVRANTEPQRELAQKDPLTEPNELDTILDQFKMINVPSESSGPLLQLRDENDARVDKAKADIEAYTNKQVVAKLNELLRAQPDVNWTNQEVTGETIHAVPVSVVEAAIATYTKPSKES